MKGADDLAEIFHKDRTNRYIRRDLLEELPHMNV